MSGDSAACYEPEINMYLPVWCHHHCGKMRVTEQNPEAGTLTIAGSAAKVTITRASTIFPKSTGWLVNWEVIQCRPRREIVRGRRQFNDDRLAAAFGLIEHSGWGDHELLKRFGGHSAEWGLYIRWRDYLNIPCPGTGHDGDPNVSIELNDEIKKAVHALLKRFGSAQG